MKRQRELNDDLDSYLSQRRGGSQSFFKRVESLIPKLSSSNKDVSPASRVNSEVFDDESPKKRRSFFWFLFSSSKSPEYDDEDLEEIEHVEEEIENIEAQEEAYEDEIEELDELEELDVFAEMDDDIDIEVETSENTPNIEEIESDFDQNKAAVTEADDSDELDFSIDSELDDIDSALKLVKGKTSRVLQS